MNGDIAFTLLFIAMGGIIGSAITILCVFLGLLR